MLIRRTIAAVGFIGGLASIYGVAVSHGDQIALFAHTVEIPLYLILLAIAALMGLGILFRKPLRRWISGTEFIPSDAASVMGLIQHRHLFEKATRVHLWLYTAETLLGPCRAMLEKLDTPLDLRVYVRRPEFDDQKREVAEGALKTAMEIATVNKNIQIKIQFYSTPPLNRLQFFHMPQRALAIMGVYRHDQEHPMQFIGAEDNQMVVLDSRRPEEKILLSAMDSQFQRLWDQSSGLRAVLFDMDGVLMDTMELHHESWKQALSPHLPLTDPIKFRKEVYRLEGMAVQETIQWFFNEYTSSPLKNQALAEQIAREKAEYHATLVEAARPFPGMAEFVTRLKARDIPLAVVSGSSRDVVGQILQRHFPGLFSTVISGDDTLQGKPHPAPYATAMDQLRIRDAESCLVVENSPLGVESGKAAGTRVMGVLQNSPLNAGELTRKGADKVFAHAEELEAFMKDL